MSDNEKPRWDPVDIMVLRRGEVSLPLPCLFLAFQPMEFDNTVLGTGGVIMSSWFSKVSAVAYAAETTERPNILWIIAEDCCPDMGCYGNPIVKTPNIDKLASEGARFNNAFMSAPVCSPARSALMTGMYQTSIGAHHHRSHRDDGYTLPEPVKVITEYFRAAGYYTSNCAGLNWTRPGKTDFNFTMRRKPFDGTDWKDRKPGQPFFAQVNIEESHRPFTKDHENPIAPDTVKVPPYYPDHPVSRQDWANYLEAIQVLDRKVGVVLQRLKDEGLYDNTIVFFFCDNGRPFPRGKGFLYDGGIRVPLIIRWPGHIKPGIVVDDLVSAIDFAPTCLSLAGIEPPSHMQGQIFLGDKAKKREYIVAARDRIDETWERIRCIRTKDFKYIRNFMPNLPYNQSNIYRIAMHPILTLMQVLYVEGKLTPEQERLMAPNKPAEELYDLSNDPDELHNMAEDPKYRTVLEEMRNKLDTWMKETKDQGDIPEDPQIAVKWYLANVPHLKVKVMKDRGLDPNPNPKEYLEYWERTLKPTLARSR